MNKTELIASIAAKTGMNKKEAEKALCAALDTIVETLKAGDRVQLVGFGTFETRARAAREGINPRTGKKISISAAAIPTFKAGKNLKESLK